MNELIKKYEVEFERFAFVEIEKLKNEGQRQDAIELIDLVLKTLPDSENLKSEKNSIQSNKPIALVDIIKIDSSHLKWGSTLFTDSFGNSYDNWIRFEATKSLVPYAVYNIDSKFSKLDAVFCCGTDTRATAKHTIEFYLDNELQAVERFEGQLKTTQPRVISVKLSGAKTLSIRAYSSENGYTYCYLANAILSP